LYEASKFKVWPKNFAIKDYTWGGDKALHILYLDAGWCELSCQSTERLTHREKPLCYQLATGRNSEAWSQPIDINNNNNNQPEVWLVHKVNVDKQVTMQNVDVMSDSCRIRY
jgi:hypothetical protein